MRGFHHPADRLLRVAVKEAGLPLADAVKMLTKTPAAILGLTHKGRLAPHMDADVVAFDEEMTVRRVFAKGACVL